MRLREQIADGDAELGAGFENAGAGDSQGKILGVGVFDERVERRVVEDGPPLAQAIFLAFNARIRVVDPALGDRRGGTRVVRADLEAIAPPIPATPTGDVTTAGQVGHDQQTA